MTLRGPALMVAILLLLGVAGVAAPAHALPEEGDPLLVEVTSVAPLNPAPDGTVSVQGVVSNRSGRDAQDLQALLRVSGQPLSSRSEVVSVTDLTTPRRGVAIESTVIDVATDLAPAAAATFTITAPTSALPLGRNGVYAFFVEVRSNLGSYTTAFPLPWFPAPDTIEPSRIVVLNPIRAGVDLSASNALLSAQLAASMASGGALSDLTGAGAAAAGGGVPITWLIDPAVTDAAARLADGTATFPLSVGDPAAARGQVAAWLRTLDAGASAPSALVYLTPYAEVDAAGVLAAGMPDLLAESISTAPTAAATSVPVRNGMIAAPPQGELGPAALQTYAAAGVDDVVLSGTVLPPRQTLAYTPSGIAALESVDGAMINAIIPDDGLAAALQRPAATPAERFRWQAGLLAEAAMITLELPVSSRTVVLLPPADVQVPPDVYAAALTALNEAPYIGLAGLPALFEPGVPRVDREQVPAAPDPAPLSDSYLAPIPGLQGRLTTFANVTTDPLAFEQDFRTALLRSASADWRADLPRGEALLGSIGTDLTTQEQEVSTVSTGTVTFTGSAGTLPLTISNGLEQAVEVGVVLQGDPAFRLQYTSPGLVRVDAGRRVSIEVPVEVFGSGPLPVRVILTDRDGRPFITAGDLTIRATGASIVAIGVVIIGAVALLVLFLWRFRRKGADAP